MQLPCPVYPGLQTQSSTLPELAFAMEYLWHGVTLTAASGQNESSGQFVQISDPVPSLYFPLSHAKQLLMFFGVYPAMHMQLEIDADCLGAMECAGHSDGTAVARGQYVSSTHSVQVSGPNSALWNPGSHGRQRIPSW